MKYYIGLDAHCKTSTFAVVDEIVRFKNRLKAVFRAEAIQADENSFYKNKERASL